jgi:hypothetical protein
MKQVLFFLVCAAAGYGMRLIALNYWPEAVVNAWFSGFFIAWFFTQWNSNVERRKTAEKVQQRWDERQQQFDAERGPRR